MACRWRGSETDTTGMDLLDQGREVKGRALVTARAGRCGAQCVPADGEAGGLVREVIVHRRRPSLHSVTDASCSFLMRWKYQKRGSLLKKLDVVMGREQDRTPDAGQCSRHHRAIPIGTAAGSTTPAAPDGHGRRPQPW